MSLFLKQLYDSSWSRKKILRAAASELYFLENRALFLLVTSPLELTFPMWLMHSNQSPALHRLKTMCHTAFIAQSNTQQKQGRPFTECCTEKVETAGIFWLEKYNRLVFIFCPPDRTKIVYIVSSG